MTVRRFAMGALFTINVDAENELSATKKLSAERACCKCAFMQRYFFLSQHKYPQKQVHLKIRQSCLQYECLGHILRQSTLQTESHFVGNQVL